jgi:MoxR-like ATPase
MSPDDYARTAKAIEAEIGKVIVGQTELVRTVLVCLLCEGHALLEGVPGLGKTMLLKTLADAVHLEFNRIQFTPDLMPADITGTQVLEETPDGRRTFTFDPGPVFANLVLADEVNRATPKSQSALLEAMQERQVTVAGETRPLPRPFLVMATQNPLEELVAVVDRTTGATGDAVQPVVDAAELAAMVELTRRVPVAEHLTRHAVDLVVATHPELPGAPEGIKRYVRFGASPRGAQALVLAAKAAALLDGRPNVSAEDLRAMARPALRHRLVLGYEASAAGVGADQLVDEVLAAVPDPPAGLRGAP